MEIDVTEIAEEIIYNGRLGVQNMKVIEVTEMLDKNRKEFLRIKFINQWGEYHIEKFYPDTHAKKLYELACAIDGVYKDGKSTIIDTKHLVGGFINAVVTNVVTKAGEVTDTAYIRNIRTCPRRKDNTGYMGFNRPPKKEVIE